MEPISQSIQDLIVNISNVRNEVYLLADDDKLSDGERVALDKAWRHLVTSFCGAVDAYNVLNP